MSRRAEYQLEARFVITPETVATVRVLCSPSARTTWVTAKDRLTINTFRGVPGKHVDVLLPDFDVEAPDAVVCEVGRKAGCFDGNLKTGNGVRWRLCFRPWHTPTDGRRKPSVQFPDKGTVQIDEEQDATVVLCRWWGGGIWAQSFPRLRFIPVKGELEPILIAQAKGWYKFLWATAEDDVRALAAMWANLPHTIACEDIAVLNRTASNALYDLATQLGWRKLTLREKRRLGLSPDSPQWQRADSLVSRLVFNDRGGNTSGCGDYTVEAASGKVLMTSYGPVEME